MSEREKRVSAVMPNDTASAGHGSLPLPAVHLHSHTSGASLHGESSNDTTVIAPKGKF